jgi:hypothetical protein
MANGLNLCQSALTIPFGPAARDQNVIKILGVVAWPQLAWDTSTKTRFLTNKIQSLQKSPRHFEP